MAKKRKRNKMDVTWDIVDDYMKKFEKMMNKASKEIRKADVGCSSHILSSTMIRFISSNMANYYDVNKVRELFQEILDEESTHAVIKAKEDRENCTLDAPKRSRLN